MNAGRSMRKRRNENGVALLISIFVLLLISVVAIAMIVASGTESSLAGNYRSSTSVYYAALAGLEEGRGRLLGKNAGSFKNTPPTLIPTPLPIGQPVYIINPVGGETVTPWVPGSTYEDREYNTEFAPAYPLPNPSPRTLSVSTVAGVQGPSYKWVRINAVSETSLNLDVDGDRSMDNKELYYDSVSVPPRLTTNSSGTQQVFEITSFAVLPNGSQKLLQYLVAPAQIALPPFLAALTLSDSPGNKATFLAPASNLAYVVKGDDQDCSGNLTGAKFAAIGVFRASDAAPGSTVLNGIQPGAKTNYTGLINPGPDVENLTAPPANLVTPTPSQLNAIVQTISQNADATITPGPPSYTANASDLTAATTGMSSSNPLTIVVNGNLNVDTWNSTGYGLLLVTGKFTYNPDTTWNGIVLVIGQGQVDQPVPKHQFNQINGAMFVANTLAGASLGGASVVFNDEMEGNGIRYSSCWIQRSQPASAYKILSFHEISQ